MRAKSAAWRNMPNCSEPYEKLSASLQYSNMDGMCFSVKSIACSVSLETGNLHLMDLIVFALFVVQSQSCCAQLNYFFRVIANFLPSFYLSSPLFLFSSKFEEGHPAFLQPVSRRSNEVPSSTWKAQQCEKQNLHFSHLYCVSISPWIIVKKNLLTDRLHSFAHMTSITAF